MSVTCCLGYQKNGSEGMREIKEQKKIGSIWSIYGLPHPCFVSFFFNRTDMS